MRPGSILAVALLAAAACKSSSDKPAAREPRKMDFHTVIDDRGRLKLTFRLFDAKHEQMPVTGSYTAEVLRPDGTLVCKAAGELTPADFSAKGTHQAPWHDASCPADPGVDELKINVKVTVPGGGKGKDDKGKDKDAGQDITFDRSANVPVRVVYERPPAKKPAETQPADGSAAKPADGSAAKPADGSAAKPADGSAAKPAEAKPAEAKPAEAKPAEAKPAEAKPAETTPAEKPAAGSAR